MRRLQLDKASARVQLLHGDMLLPDWGLSPADKAQLRHAWPLRSMQAVTR